MRARAGVLVLSIAVFAGLLWTAGAQALSLCGPCFEKWQKQVVKDRDLAREGRLKLGALSDGHFEVTFEPSKARIVISMPPLRAKQLDRTRRLVAKRYEDAPIVVRLAPFSKPRRIGPPGRSPRPGKPLFCPAKTLDRGERRAKWNARRMIGRPLAKAERMASAHNCGLRIIWIDGMILMATSDLRYDRVNVAVRNGKVRRILGIG